MSVLIDEKDLPLDLTTEQAIDAAYASELAEVESKLRRGIACLLECDKDLAPFLYARLRDRMRKQPGRPGLAFLVCSGVDTGGQGQDAAAAGMSQGLIGTMIRQLRDFVTRAVEQKVIVLPHLDLLTTSQGGLTAEAKEVIPLLYQNPDNVLLGFKDPSFAVPRVIENLFPHRVSLVGIARGRLRHLMTQKESRKFGRQFNPWQLYKYVSGVNAVRLRKVLSTLEGEDYPADPRNAYRQIRQATLTGTLEVPNVQMDRDIGGYDKVKRQIRQEILDVLARRDQLTDPEDIARLEELIPRGMILWGPPGTGKTFLAKAMATALGAAITIVSGPELKSKWVGESEENLRRIFHQARQSAPSIIVFDELDSFASARGTYQGSGVEHSMVNQLLTEMDGFHKGEMVFVIGTTNLVEMLDPALLRPGRFEFHLHIPYPDDDDRREILRIYDRKMRLQLTDEALEYAVRRTSESFLTPAGTPFSGDHLNALCRAVARIRLREGPSGPTTPDDVERGLTEYEERVQVSDEDAVLVATHEAGHFVCSLCCPRHRPPERITIQSKIPWVPFYTEFQKEDTRRVGHSRSELLDMMCVLYGGIEAERLLRGEISTGAGGYGDPRSDLSRATQLAHLMVEVLGMGGQTTGLRFFRDGKGERQVLSGVQAEAIDRQVNTLIAEGQHRAATILGEHKDDLERLRDELVTKKTIEGDRVREIIEDFRRRYPPPEAAAKKDCGNSEGGGRKRARAADK
jgi:cell division protease FtsH